MRNIMWNLLLLLGLFSAPAARAQLMDQYEFDQLEQVASCPGWLISDYACSPNPDAEVCEDWHVEGTACWVARAYNVALRDVECSDKYTTRAMYCGGAVNYCSGRVKYTAYSDGALPADAPLQVSGYKNAKWRKCTSYVWKFGHDYFQDWFTAQRRERYETSLYGAGCVGGS